MRDYNGESVGDADDEMWFDDAAAAFYPDSSMVPSALDSLPYTPDTLLAPSPGSGSLFFSDPLYVPPGLVPGNSSYGSPSGISLMDVEQPQQPASSQPGPSSRQLFCKESNCKNVTGFKRQSDLKRHQKTHVKPFACDECDRSFGSKADAARHRREVHLKDENNARPTLHFCTVRSCKRSSRGFGRLWNMQAHMRKAHPGVPVPEGGSSAGSPGGSFPPLPALGTPGAITSSSESEPPTPTPLFELPEDGSDTSMVRRILEEEVSRLGRKTQKLHAYIQQLDSQQVGQGP